jgi:two-component system, OmpR family, phosphate regulon sensor histidine kinase PhoR
MLPTVLIGLALALLWALRTIWADRRAVRRLHVAIQTNRPLVRSEKSGVGTRDWEQLCGDVNALTEEMARLKQARANQLEQLQATLGSLQEAVLIVDHTNHIILANNALANIFPKARNILNQRLERALHSLSFLTYVESVRKGNAQPQQELEFTEGNKTIWVEVTGSLISPLDSERERWALFVIHDVTKLKKLEVVRKEFVANVSHELRTPLSVIKGYVETLVDGHRDMPLDDRDRFLRTIQRHTERLNSLLEDLLTLSRLESINPGLQRETANLNELLRTVVDDFKARPSSADRRLSFNPDDSLQAVLMDPLKITQVVENLIENALKYSPKDSQIELRSRVRGNDVEVSVKDDGPGIPELDLPHIFERFYRVDKGRSREKGGTGLGLSIVKHIVQLHQGKVWLESQLGQGTTFYFSLPLREKQNEVP